MEQTLLGTGPALCGRGISPCFLAASGLMGYRHGMAKPISEVAVLGAGVMGAAIAAHLANAGIRVRLLDLPGDPAKKQRRNHG